MSKGGVRLRRFKPPKPKSSHPDSLVKLHKEAKRAQKRGDLEEAERLFEEYHFQFEQFRRANRDRLVREGKVQYRPEHPYGD